MKNLTLSLLLGTINAFSATYAMEYCLIKPDEAGFTSNTTSSPEDEQKIELNRIRDMISAENDPTQIRSAIESLKARSGAYPAILRAIQTLRTQNN
jgi:hypothetical protein